MSESKFMFTGKVGAHSISSMIIDDGKMVPHFSYRTMVEIVGHGKVAVNDNTSSTGMMEGESRHEAIKKGKEFIRRMNEAGKVISS